MAYRRLTRRFRPRTTRRYGRKKTSTTRKYSVRRRPARRMSTRTILNRTSQKKRDNMLSFSNTSAESPFGEDYSATGAVMRFPVGQTNPGSEFIFIFNATGRPGESSTGQRGSKLDTSLRTSESIYAVGLKERITLETNNAAPWEWRRICFASKDDFGEADPDTSKFFRRTSNGMVRLVSAQETPNYFNDQLFEGERNSDWLSAITAPVSHKHYAIKYDKTRVIRSSNNSGTIKNVKLWHPMHHNIVYDGEQSGESMVDSATSVTGRPGMGNYYIVDIFRKHGVNDNDSTLTFTPEATFYWHEK
ncbi:capsid protein [Capybara genomovirus 12]|uniref:Capsid protein n=1 Tax=Capybara genomovirus 12 TaxID=2582939 RepID=A0A4V1FVM3_9VIRU|nr:capsid protein [Capybara genomovirus 12]QCS35904.1 capsid protein [Capybara genomovirus 12]